MFGTEMLGPWAITALIGLTTILLLYWLSIDNHTFWKKRGVVYEKPLPFFLSITGLFKKPAHEVEIERFLKYGPIYGYFEGNRPKLTVGDPALVRDILVKDFPAFCSRSTFHTGEEILDLMLTVRDGDDDWKRIRSIVTPTFSTGKIKRMMGIFGDCTKTLIQNFRHLENEAKFVDAKNLYSAFSMDVIASFAFSTKIDSHNDPDNQFVVMAKKIFGRKFDWRFFLYLTFPKLTKLCGVDVFNTAVLNFFKMTTLQIVEERKRIGQTRNDFLQLLLDTAKEVADYQEEEKGDIASNYDVRDDINPHILKNKTSKNFVGLSQEELVSQSVLFFLAGYHTTASTLSSASYSLATNPDIQDRLREEVDQAIREANGELTYEAIQSMKYLDNVISETIRRYPTGFWLERKAEYDYNLGNTGITIPKDVIVTIPVYAMNQNPKVFPNPEKFDPDRFSPEEKAKRDRYAYLPFGAGPRSCVATRFALMEIKVCLAHVVANFIIKTCPETKVPLELYSSPKFLQPKGVILRMEIRKDSPVAE